MGLVFEYYDIWPPILANSYWGSLWTKPFDKAREVCDEIENEAMKFICIREVNIDSACLNATVMLCKLKEKMGVIIFFICLNKIENYSQCTIFCYALFAVP